MRSRGAEGLALDGVTGAHVVRPVRTQDGDSLEAATVRREPSRSSRYLRNRRRRAASSSSVLLENRCVDLVLSYLGSDAPTRETADPGAAADMTAALLEGAE